VGRQPQFQHEFPRGGGDVYGPEAGIFVDAPCPGVVGRDQQPHPAAIRNTRQMLQHRLHRQRTIAVALMRPPHCEPPQPPAGAVGQRRMNHVEPGQRPPGFDRDDRMCRPMPDRRDNVGDRTEKPVNLVRIEVQRGDQAEFGSSETPIAKRQIAS
jgi:hypothetical protein